MTKLDPIVAVAIAVLGAIFIGSLIAFVFVLRHKFCKKKDMISEAQENTDPDQTLVDQMEGDGIDRSGEMDIDGINIMPPIDELLQDEDWVDDATGLIPHCLPILKACHQLTEKLVAMTMGNAGQLRSPESLTEIVTIAKRISPRVDDVVRSMYPPLDPRLLEARCTALVLSVTHLVIVTKNACRLNGFMDWIDQSLADIEDHLAILREASINVEHAIRLSVNSYSAAASVHPEPMNISHLPSTSHDHHLANGHVANMSHDQHLVNGHVANMSHDNHLANGHVANMSHDNEQKGHSSRSRDQVSRDHTWSHDQLPKGHASYVDKDSIQLTEKIKTQLQLSEQSEQPKHLVSSSANSTPTHRKMVMKENCPDIQQGIHKNTIQVPLTVHCSNETSQV